MPVGTSDGEVFKDEFDHALSQVNQPQIETPIINPDDAPKAQEAPLSYGGEKLRTAWNRLTGSGEEERQELWPEKAARGLISGFMLPGDVASGAVDPDSEQARGRAFELAQGMIFGPAPVANKIVDGTLGSIAGVKALTANRPNLDLAMQMAEKGMEKDQIWEATGWYKGLEGKWRHEIPDVKAQFKDSFAKHVADHINDKENILTFTLAQALKHDELFKAYPELKDVRLQVNNSLNVYGRVITDVKGGKTIIINPSYILEKGQVHPLEVVLHEIQHNIQDKESFNQGINPSAALRKALDFIVDRFKSVDNFEDKTRLGRIWWALAMDARTSVGSRLSDVLYRRSPGEIEARTVERRGKGTLIEPPYITEQKLEKPLPFPGEIAP